jgi:uncharacterized protein (DUF1778 family)
MRVLPKRERDWKRIDVEAPPLPALPRRASLRGPRPTFDMRAICMSLSYRQQRNWNFAMSSSSVLSVRLSDQERALLEAASSQSRTNLSDFVRRKALEAAEVDVLERRIITIPAKDWERFEAWARKPARKIAGLKDLALRPSTWRT